MVLKILNISTSTYYDSQRPKSSVRRRGQAPPGYSAKVDGEAVYDDEIVSILKAYRSDPFLKVEGGSKVLAKYIRRDYNIIINHKKVARLCKLHNLLLKSRGKKKSKFKKMSQNRSVTAENQVWEFDIKYGYLHGEKRFFFLLAFIDVFNREIKGYYVGRRCKATDLLSTFKIALIEQGISEDMNLVIRSDNGPQMRSNLFEEHLEGLPAEHEFIPLKNPNKNAHIESFFSIYDLHLQEQYFWGLKDAYQWTTEFIDFYNEDRIHGSLGKSPRAFSRDKSLILDERFIQVI